MDFSNGICLQRTPKRKADDFHGGGVAQYAKRLGLSTCGSSTPDGLAMQCLYTSSDVPGIMPAPDASLAVTAAAATITPVPIPADNFVGCQIINGAPPISAIGDDDRHDFEQLLEMLRASQLPANAPSPDSPREYNGNLSIGDWQIDFNSGAGSGQLPGTAGAAQNVHNDPYYQGLYSTLFGVPAPRPSSDDFIGPSISASMSFDPSSFFHDPSSASFSGAGALLSAISPPSTTSIPIASGDAPCNEPGRNGMAYPLLQDLASNDHCQGGRSVRTASDSLGIGMLELMSPDTSRVASMPVGLCIPQYSVAPSARPQVPASKRGRAMTRSQARRTASGLMATLQSSGDVLDDRTKHWLYMETIKNPSQFRKRCGKCRGCIKSQKNEGYPGKWRILGHNARRLDCREETDPTSFHYTAYYLYSHYHLAKVENIVLAWKYDQARQGEAHSQWGRMQDILRSKEKSKSLRQRKLQLCRYNRLFEFIRQKGRVSLTTAAEIIKYCQKRMCRYGLTSPSDDGGGDDGMVYYGETKTSQLATFIQNAIALLDTIEVMVQEPYEGVHIYPPSQTTKSAQIRRATELEAGMIIDIDAIAVEYIAKKRQEYASRITRASSNEMLNPRTRAEIQRQVDEYIPDMPEFRDLLSDEQVVGVIEDTVGVDDEKLVGILTLLLDQAIAKVQLASNAV
ncbi:hypothetical protein EV182_002344 [Spiromyces aspiralis]|uniref:Uncharacterized protein n=1 Tax=Spiromyces aspiralis TaxID=68401 RepID=A0ACC1HGY4_9FUNG|nr:hypothetical protein EV182_002344 [Spiromyces aspiralis]